MPWKHQAACAGDPDPDAWFASRVDSMRRARAVSICQRCPVAYECLSAALDRDDRYGIWGGLLPEERDPAMDSWQAVVEALDVLGGRATISELATITGLSHRDVGRRLEALHGSRVVLRIAPATYALAESMVVSDPCSTVGPAVRTASSMGG